MLVLRFARTGRRNQPKYRLVVAEHSKPVDGKVVAVLGHYDPTGETKPFVVDKEAVSAWLAKGAQPSESVARVLNKQAGFELPVHQNAPRPPRKAAKDEAKPATAIPATEAAVVAEGNVVEETVAADATPEAAATEPSVEAPVETPVEAPVMVESNDETPATVAETSEVESVEPAAEVKEEVAAEPTDEPKSE